MKIKMQKVIYSSGGSRKFSQEVRKGGAVQLETFSRADAECENNHL